MQIPEAVNPVKVAKKIFGPDKHEQNSHERKSIEGCDDESISENVKSSKKEKKDKKHKSEKKDKAGKKEKKPEISQPKPETPSPAVVTNVEPIATPVPLRVNTDLISLLNKGVDEKNKMANAKASRSKIEANEKIPQVSDSSLQNIEALLYLQHLKKAVDNWTDEGSYYFKSTFVPPGIMQFRNDLISLPAQEKVMPLFHQIVRKLYDLCNSNDKNESKGLSLYKKEYSTVMQNFPDCVEAILNTHNSYKFRPGHL